MLKKLKLNSSVKTCKIFLELSPKKDVLFIIEDWNAKVGSQETPAAAAAAAKSLQSCLTRCDHIDGIPPGSAVPGILQARTLEWIAISFSNAWKWKVKVKLFIRVRLLATPWTAAYQAPPSMDSPGKSTGVGCHCLLQNRAFHVLKQPNYETGYTILSS